MESGSTSEFTISNISPNQTLDVIINKRDSEDWLLLFKNETGKRDDLSVKNNYTIVYVDGKTLKRKSEIHFDEILYTGHFFRESDELFIIGRGALVSTLKITTYKL